MRRYLKPARRCLITTPALPQGVILQYCCLSRLRCPHWVLVKKFENRDKAAARIWKALQRLNGGAMAEDAAATEPASAAKAVSAARLKEVLEHGKAKSGQHATSCPARRSGYQSSVSTRWKIGSTKSKPRSSPPRKSTPENSRQARLPGSGRRPSGSWGDHVSRTFNIL